MCYPGHTRIPNGVVYGFATRSPKNARQTVTDNNINHVYDTYDDLLADQDIDAVYIPLPNHLHHPWTLKALQAGKHVLCEKPLACDESEAQEMVDAAAAAGLLLMEGMMYRFHPRSQGIKQTVAKGEIGRVSLVRSAFCFKMDDELLASGNNARLKTRNGWRRSAGCGVLQCQCGSLVHGSRAD